MVLWRDVVKSHLRIQRADNLDECQSEAFVNAVVSFRVGSGKRRFVYRCRDTESIEDILMYTKAQPDVSQGFARGQLTEQHILQLIGTIDLSHSMISIVLLYETLENLTWPETGGLRLVA